MIFPAIVISVVVCQRLSELALARRNYVWAMQNGGREYGGKHYWMFVVLHTTWLLGILIESFLFQPSLPALWPLFLGLVIFAQVLRYWAIASLGRLWNTRIVIVQGSDPVRTGPYRFLKHPNYLAVVIEICAIPALLGAWRSALLFSIINAILLLFIRIPAEKKAMRG